MERKDSGEVGFSWKFSMDKPTKNTGSWAGGIAVATLLALVSAAAIAAVSYDSQKYRDCIAGGDVSSDQCKLLHPEQR